MDQTSAYENLEVHYIQLLVYKYPDQYQWIEEENIVENLIKQSLADKDTCWFETKGKHLTFR